MSVLSLLGISQSQRQQSLNSVQVKAETQFPNIPMYDLSHLEDMIQFGRTHLRKTFNQMWLEERHWVIWFAQRYTTWNKLDHRLVGQVLRFEGVAEAENWNRKVTSASRPMPRWQRPRPKAKSQAGSSGNCQETPALHLNKIDQKWEEMEGLIKIQNSGPSSYLIRQQRFQPEMVAAAADMQCSTCVAQQKPRTSRPSAIHCLRDFHDNISTDGYSWKT